MPFHRQVRLATCNPESIETLDRIPAYASSLGPEGVEEQAEQCIALGLDNVKVKLGFGHSLDEQNLRTARTILGDEATLMVDANQAWSL